MRTDTQIREDLLESLSSGRKLTKSFLRQNVRGTPSRIDQQLTELVKEGIVVHKRRWFRRANEEEKESYLRRQRKIQKARDAEEILCQKGFRARAQGVLLVLSFNDTLEEFLTSLE